MYDPLIRLGTGNRSLTDEIPLSMIAGNDLLRNYAARIQRVVDMDRSSICQTIKTPAHK
jgi:hypothetical protein